MLCCYENHFNYLMKKRTGNLFQQEKSFKQNLCFLMEKKSFHKPSITAAADDAPIDK